jgi:hypothetical protein
MWEMQQLGRRAGALNIDLMLKQPGKQKWRISLEYKLLSSLLGVVLERWKMFEGRAAQAVMISLLSTDEARGINSFPDVHCECLDLCEGCSSWLYICFELCCLIVGEIFFQSTQLSGVC